MKLDYTELPGGARLSYGAEEFVFVELAEEMDLRVSLQVQAITTMIEKESLDGVSDIVPAHVSYLIKVDPESLDSRKLVPVLKDIHDKVINETPQPVLSRIVEIPVLYDDPWSHEVVVRSRDRHPSPDEIDIEYVTRINGMSDTSELIAAHSAYPHIATFNCFVPGNAECVQLVPRSMQLESPKYLRPRTETPERAVGHGGCHTNIYPSSGPGGFQLLGRSAVPVIDFTQTISGFEESPVLLQRGTVIKYLPVELDEYTRIEQAVEDRVYKINTAEIEFDLDAFNKDPLGYARSLVGELS